MMLTTWFKRRRPGALKFWGDFPVKLFLHHLEDIYVALLTDGAQASQSPYSPHTPSGEVRVESQGRELTNPTELNYDPRVRKPSYVSFHRHDFVVFLGPRTVYAYATVANARTRATMHAVESIVRSASRPLGAFVLRTWGAVVLAFLAFLVPVLAFAQADAIFLGLLGVATGITSLYVFYAIYLICLAKVRIETQTTEGTWWSRNGDALVATAVGTVIATLIASGLLWLATSLANLR